MAGEIIDLETVRALKAGGNTAEVSSALTSLLEDHMKLLNHLRELRMAGVEHRLSADQEAEIDQAAEEVSRALETIGQAIQILRE